MRMLSRVLAASSAAALVILDLECPCPAASTSADLSSIHPETHLCVWPRNEAHTPVWCPSETVKDSEEEEEEGGAPGSTPRGWSK